ncbi:copper homeostasis protein [Bifidobacterium primatium]|uniref:PF03932 family protein CutC n=1 Tax=Bifidobacterium primatium TaxID=2045438 RepID=A0A2M9H6K8_9BIFI|nr:copper homeostasis protein CutC [Bifidobacterium primatium]PJM72448.1 copper homeostasis protein [Bifidobacterium primatium]
MRYADALHHSDSVRPVLEIAVQDVKGARIAQQAGADRIELCSALGPTGGLTPSFGAIRLCAEAAPQLGVQVLIRSRGGDFVYDDDDKAMQLADVRPALEAGASGLVVGGLDANGSVDIRFARLLIETAHEEAERLGRSDIDMTFHRAFDVVNDRRKALETLISLGYTRILTSGGAPSAPEGVNALAELTDWAAGRIEIMAGGGLRPQDFSAVSATGVDALHLSAKHVVKSAGGPGGGGVDAMIERTDERIVREAVRVLHGIPMP